MIESGLARPYDFETLNQRSQQWVSLNYEYIKIRNEVRIAEAA